MGEEFRSRGVRALVRLHEIEMRKLWEVWKRARQQGVRLPETDDPDYRDLDSLMRHPLRAARGYLVWFCEKSGRPDPEIPPTPEPEEIFSGGEEYLDTVLAAWRHVLAGASDAELESRTAHLSRWKAPYTLEAMLEHAVVHPMRHRMQLEERIES